MKDNLGDSREDGQLLLGGEGEVDLPPGAARLSAQGGALSVHHDPAAFAAATRPGVGGGFIGGGGGSKGGRVPHQLQ